VQMLMSALVLMPFGLCWKEKIELTPVMVPIDFLCFTSSVKELQLIKLVQLAAQTDADVKGASRDPGFSIEKLLFAMAQK